MVRAGTDLMMQSRIELRALQTWGGGCVRAGQRGGPK